MYGYASLTDVTIESNEAEYGGGIALLGFSNLSIGDGDIRSNQAVEQGGGVYIGGSASFSAFATSISENTVTAISPSGFGGGIYAEDTDTDQQVAGFYLADDSLIEGNEANFGGGIAMVGADGTLFGVGIHGNGLAEAAAVGGGVYATSDSYLSMVDVELSQNQAARGGGIHLEHSTLTCDADCLIHEHGGEFSDTDIIEGGGISAVTNSRIVADGYPDPLQGTIDLVDNTAVFGGGLFLQDSSFGCYNCSLEQNSATSTDPDFAPQGGGIYAWSTDPLLRHQTRVAMSYAEMIQNVSDNLGGALYLDGAVADFELTQFKGNVAEFASVAHVKGSVLTSMDSVYAGNHALNSSVFRGIPRDSIIDIASYLRIEGGTIQDNENGSLLGPSVAFVGDDTLFLARSVEIDGHHGESCFEVNGDEARLSLEYSEILQNTHTATGAALVMRHGLASSSSSDWGASGSIDDNLPYDIIFPDTDALPLDDVITDVTCDSAGCY